MNMKFYNKITIALASLAVLASCTGQDDTFENKLFINAENFRNEVRVATDEGVGDLGSAIGSDLFLAGSGGITAARKQRDAQGQDQDQAQGFLFHIGFLLFLITQSVPTVFFPHGEFWFLRGSFRPPLLPRSTPAEVHPL